MVILTEILHINLSILDWLKYAIDKIINFFYVKKLNLNMDNYIDSLNIKKNIIFCNGSLVEFLKCIALYWPTGATIEALGYNCKLLIPLIDAWWNLSQTNKDTKKCIKFQEIRNFLKNLKSVKLIKIQGN